MPFCGIETFQVWNLLVRRMLSRSSMFSMHSYKNPIKICFSSFPSTGNLDPTGILVSGLQGLSQYACEWEDEGKSMIINRKRTHVLCKYDNTRTSRSRNWPYEDGKGLAGGSFLLVICVASVRRLHEICTCAYRELVREGWECIANLH